MQFLKFPSIPLKKGGSRVVFWITTQSLDPESDISTCSGYTLMT